jgi:hypothetical protein
MREHRARRRACVTDQGFDGAPRERKVASEETLDANTEDESLHLRAAQQCMVCGRASRFARWWPARSQRRRR